MFNKNRVGIRPFGKRAYKLSDAVFAAIKFASVAVLRSHKQIAVPCARQAIQYRWFLFVLTVVRLVFR